MDIPTLRNAYVAKKKVLVRTGFDLPLDADGNITDDTRIMRSIPTIRYLLEHGAEQVIIMTHTGRPKGNEARLRTDKIAKRLSGILEEEVTKIDDLGENGIPDPKVDRIVMLENLRFDPREKSKEASERDSLGKQLATLADLYINDSFSTCHRDHASMTSIPKFMPGCIGLSVEEEVTTITDALKEPERPFVSIIGGVKADKLNAVANLLERVDKILIGGALAFTLLKKFGKEVGKTRTDTEGLSGFDEIITKIKESDKVILPVDAMLGCEFKEDTGSKVCTIEGMDPEWMALDIGPETIRMFREEISRAKTIIWNGPMGVFEFEKFAEGTKEVARAMAETDAIKIVGGGDSGAAVERSGLKDKMTLVSSGGGASLELFEGKELIALKALVKNYP